MTAIQLATLADAAGIPSGTSFPGSPSTDDIFRRTDLDLIFFYDGARWLTTTLYTDSLIPTTAIPISATSASHRTALPLAGLLGVWLEDFWNSFYITGGTALSASHKWTCVLSLSPSAGTLATHTIDSGALDTYRNSGPIAVDTAIATTQFMLNLVSTKTGTPGTLILTPRISYRLIGT